MSEQQKMDADLRQIVTEALVSMVSGVTGLVPPTGPGAIPDFIQAPIDRAVERISASLPVGVPDGWMLVPVEPTPEMREFAQDNLALEGLSVSDWLICTTYSQMLAYAQLYATAAQPTVKAEQVQCSDERPCIPCFADDGECEAPSLPAAGSAVEEVEVRGLQWLDTGHYRKKPPQFGYNPHDWNPLMTVAQHKRIVAQLAARDAGEVRVPVELLAVLASEGLSETESDRYVDAVMDARALLAQRERGGE